MGWICHALVPTNALMPTHQCQRFNANALMPTHQCQRFNANASMLKNGEQTTVAAFVG